MVKHCHNKKSSFEIQAHSLSTGDAAAFYCPLGMIVLLYLGSSNLHRGVAQPGSAPEWGSLNNPQTLSKTLISNFIASRRQGLSPRTLEFYHDRLIRAWSIVGLQVQAHDINITNSNNGENKTYCA